MIGREEGFGRFSGQAIQVDLVSGILTCVALVLVPVLNTSAALLFLLFGTLTIAVRPSMSFSEIWQNKALLILPAFCCLSVVWSEVGSLTLRFAVQLTATFLIAIVLASRLTSRLFLKTIFVVLLATIVVSTLFGTYRETGALLGFYGSKNAMGIAAALATVMAVGLLGFAGERMWLRLVAVAGVLAGVDAVIRAQSVGAMGYMVVGIGAYFSIIWLRRIPLIRRLVASAFLIFLMLLAVALIAANSDTVAEAVLDTTGKDITLTGRTDLWRVAIDLISERPLLGVGYQAFWVRGNPTAETLWELFDIQSRSGFNFHNTYLSNAVEIGIIGVTIQVFLIGAAVVQSARLSLRTGDRPAALMFAISIMFLASTAIEALVFFQFNLTSVLFVAIIIYGSRRQSSIASERDHGELAWK